MSGDNTNNAVGDAADNAADNELATTMGFAKFASKATQYRGQHGRRWNGSLGRRPESWNKPESHVSSGMPGRSAAAPSAAPAPELPPPPMSKPSASTLATRERDRYAAAPDSAGGDPKHKPRKNKTRKERMEAHKAKTPVPGVPGGLNDTTNRRPQRGNMPGGQYPVMRRHEGEEGGVTINPRDNQKAQKAINIPKETKVSAITPNKIAGQPLDMEGLGALLFPKDQDSVAKAGTDKKSDIDNSQNNEVPQKEAEGISKPDTREVKKEELEAAPPLNKWSPIFPVGGPRPILKPLDDGSNEASKRTNYIDEQGNYHAPNGTIMTRELLNMFANGKLRNSLGDRVYFMPSFLDDIPPKGQKPVKLAPTPYRIFYDPKELEKAQC
ncbi:hypothetical protein MauCBS54593_001385 [Microsporum audouinii]